MSYKTNLMFNMGPRTSPREDYDRLMCVEWNILSTITSVPGQLLLDNLPSSPSLIGKEEY